MMQCVCHAGLINSEPANWVLLVMPDLTTRRVCTDCINFMWLGRNEEYASQQKAAEETEEAANPVE